MSAVNTLNPPPQPRPSPKPKQRTKTFTGCWTCRARRVKCDEHKPHCLRCRRSDRSCQGYNVRLGWLANCHGTVPRRQIRSAGRREDGALSAESLAGIFTDLDSCSADAVLVRGPFSVFSVELPGFGQSQGREDNLATELRDGHAVSDVHDTQINNDPKHYTMEDITGMTNRQSSAVIPNDTPDIATEEFVPVSESPATVVSTSTVTNIGSDPLPQLDGILGDMNGYPTENPITPIINPTPIPMPEVELVHHWVIFLSENMLLVDTADNPCRTVFMPMALQGLDALDPEASMHLAVFHAICAASAFSLFHLRNEPRYHSLAIRHDQRALCQLRRNLQLGSGRLDEPTLAAVLTCITAEAMSGRRSRWRAHVAGVLGLLEKEIYRGWIQSPTAAQLLQSYLSLSLLCNLRLPAQLVALLRGPPEMGSYLERSHGVTRALVEFLAHIMNIKESKRLVSAVELDQLELRLYLSVPRVETETPDSEVIQRAVNSFYYATVIYFRRTLRNASVADVRDLVQKAIQNLEAAEAQGRGGCAYNWAGFVVAAECDRPDLQGRMLDWFDRKRRHGIKNIDSLRELVKIVWERRMSTATDIHWQDLAVESDFDIMFV